MSKIEQLHHIIVSYENNSIVTLNNFCIITICVQLVIIVLLLKMHEIRQPFLHHVKQIESLF